MLKFLLRHSRLVVSPLLVALTIAVIDFPLKAQQEAQLTNVEWKVEGDFVILTYDLAGSTDETYEVNIVLLREQDRSFRIVPRSVRGDVGKGKFAGRGRQIRWEFKKDVAEGLRGEGYYFEITADRVTSSNVWWYIGGGVAVAGGVAALVLGKKETATPAELPAAPGRPSN